MALSQVLPPLGRVADSAEVCTQVLIADGSWPALDELMGPAELIALRTQLPTPLPRPERTEERLPRSGTLPPVVGASPTLVGAAPGRVVWLPRVLLSCLGMQDEMLNVGLPPAMAVVTDDWMAVMQVLTPLGRFALPSAVVTHADTAEAICEGLVVVVPEVGTAFMMQALRLDPRPESADDRPSMFGTCPAVVVLTDPTGVVTWVWVPAPAPPAAAAIPRPAALKNAMILPRSPARNPPNIIRWFLSLMENTLCAAL